jgi:ribulose-5-phosphate 4-epimerase/fuculose-1-phosphate aldolase
MSGDDSYSELRAEVLAANLRLGASGLVHGSFGNVSGVERGAGIVIIKPSGVPYAQLSVEALAVVSLRDGAHFAGLAPSSDAPTHLELYRSFPDIGGVAHTHSTWATSWAQACRPLPCLGTTHADYFHGTVPCSRALTAAEINGDYEAMTGRVTSHGPFTWGVDARDAVEVAIVLEDVAQMAGRTVMLCESQPAITQALLDRHYWRKHGRSAYYGQGDHTA